MKKMIWSISIILCTNQACALDLICTPESSVYLMPSEHGMKTVEIEYKTLHRFSGGKLYLTDVQDKRGEYLYGDVTEVSYHRYISQNKTIAFGYDERKAIVSHVDNIYGQLYVLKCAPTAK